MQYESLLPQPNIDQQVDRRRRVVMGTYLECTAVGHPKPPHSSPRAPTSCGARYTLPSRDGPRRSRPIGLGSLVRGRACQSMWPILQCALVWCQRERMRRCIEGIAQRTGTVGCCIGIAPLVMHCRLVPLEAAQPCLVQSLASCMLSILGC